MDAIEQFEEAVAAKLQRNPRLSKADATTQVCREQPELRQAYVDAYNLRHAAAVNPRRR